MIRPHLQFCISPFLLSAIGPETCSVFCLEGEMIAVDTFRPDEGIHSRHRLKTLAISQEQGRLQSRQQGPPAGVGTLDQLWGMHMHNWNLRLQQLFRSIPAKGRPAGAAALDNWQLKNDGDNVFQMTSTWPQGHRAGADSSGTHSVSGMPPPKARCLAKGRLSATSAGKPDAWVVGSELGDTYPYSNPYSNLTQNWRNGLLNNWSHACRTRCQLIAHTPRGPSEQHKGALAKYK